MEIKSIIRRAAMMLARGVVRSADDGGALQRLTAGLMADEEISGIERVQEYGFTSVPVPGADAVLVFIGGNRDHGVVIAVDDRRYRLKGLKSGEVAIYDDQGQVVKLSRTGIIISAPLGVVINGSVVVNGDVIASGVSLVNHDHPGDSGGTTGAPNT